MAKKTKKQLSLIDTDALLKTLEARFEKNTKRHKNIEWSKVLTRLKTNAEKMWTLNEMEKTDGEPDVIGQDKKSGEFIFVDCAAESP